MGGLPVPAESVATADRPPPKGPPGPPAIRYGLAVFLGAFLLFQVQPIVAKALLPWFGGTPAVWTLCMLFFQVLLVGGYAYAHFVSNRLSRRAQGWVHVALLLLCLCFLRILPSDSWRASDAPPAWRILAILTVTIGVPYFVLSTTGPLLQAWFRSRFPDRSPYRLYALSNIGSLLALLTYPFVVEPLFPLATQATAWAGLFVIFAVTCAACAFGASAAAARPPSGDIPAEPAAAPVPSAQPDLRTRLLWLVLPALASVLLLATTNTMTQNISVVPFLWILPLSVYLLSFILCFDSDRWYWRPVWLILLALAAGTVVATLLKGVYLHVLVQAAVYTLTLFEACMVCHGELVRRKPDPAHLTRFYLYVAVGGALGGAAVALVAPMVLTGPWEYHLAWLALIGIVFLLLLRDPSSWLHPGRHLGAFSAEAGASAIPPPGGFRARCARLLARQTPYIAVWVLLLVLYGAFGFGLYTHYRKERRNLIARSRNFYGNLQVEVERATGSLPRRLVLVHNQINHGFQFSEGAHRYMPVSYYGPRSGVGAAVRGMRELADAPEHALRIGVVGLGAGAMAAWGKDGDTLRFYEINPLVLRMSDRYFSYRRDTRAAVHVILGDARLSLEREASDPREPRLHILVLDAFSGDAIPLHLLTTEAFAVYWERLEPDGVLAVHISNRYLELGPLVRGLAEKAGKHAILYSNQDDDESGIHASSWVLVTGNGSFLNLPATQENRNALLDRRKPLVFTDQYSNLFRLLKKQRLVSR